MKRRGWWVAAAGALLFLLWLVLSGNPAANTALERKVAPPQSANAKTTSELEPAPSTTADGLDNPSPQVLVENSSREAGEICGRVISATTSKPVPQAEVTFGSASGAGSVASDAKGEFCFIPEHPGTFQIASVRAAHFVPFGPDWGRSPLSVTAAPGVRVRNLVIALTPSFELRILVEDSAGAPVPGASVRLLSPRSDELVLYPMPDRFTADAKGEAHVSAAEGTIVEAWHAKKGRGREEVSDESARTGVLRVRLDGSKAAPENATLSGRVLDADGAPAAGALVSAQSASRAYPRVFGDRDGYRAFADDEGKFTFADLEPGTYDVSAYRVGASPARKADVKVPNEGLELRLSAGARVVGRVTDPKGQPVPGFSVGLDWRKGPLELLEIHTSTVANPVGTYGVEGVAPGSYVLRILSPGYAPHEQPLSVPPDTTEVRADVTLRTGATVSGVVRSSAGGPLSGATLSVEGLAGRSTLAAETDATTDATGAFSISGLPDTPVSLHVTAPGHNRRVVAGVTPGAPLTIELTAADPDAGTKTEMVGIGAVLKGRDDALVIGEVFSGGGAAQAGLMPGDEVVSIDGTLVTALGFKPSIDAIRGVRDSAVVLGIRKGGKPPPVAVMVQRRKIGA